MSRNWTGPNVDRFAVRSWNARVDKISRLHRDGTLAYHVIFNPVSLFHSLLVNVSFWTHITTSNSSDRLSSSYRLHRFSACFSQICTIDNSWTTIFRPVTWITSNVCVAMVILAKGSLQWIDELSVWHETYFNTVQSILWQSIITKRQISDRYHRSEDPKNEIKTRLLKMDITSFVVCYSHSSSVMSLSF